MLTIKKNILFERYDQQKKVVDMKLKKMTEEEVIEFMRQMEWLEDDEIKEFKEYEISEEVLNDEVSF